MYEKHLCVKLKDHRKYLTFQKNLPSLIEFAKTFGAEIYHAEAIEEEKPLDLKALTAAICSPDAPDETKIILLERIFPRPKRSRQDILKEAKKIQRFIQKRLLSGKPVSLKELKDKYKDSKFTDACLCHHLAIARKQLANQGHLFRKLGAGTYCLSASTTG